MNNEHEYFRNKEILITGDYAKSKKNNLRVSAIDKIELIPDYKNPLAALFLSAIGWIIAFSFRENLTVSIIGIIVALAFTGSAMFVKFRKVVVIYGGMKIELCSGPIDEMQEIYNALMSAWSTLQKSGSE